MSIHSTTAAQGVTSVLTDTHILALISSFLRCHTDLDMGYTVIQVSCIAPAFYGSLVLERNSALDLYHLIADELFVRHEEQVFLYQQSMLTGANWDYEEGDWLNQIWVYEQMRASGWDDSD